MQERTSQDRIESDVLGNSFKRLVAAAYRCDQDRIPGHKRRAHLHAHDVLNHPCTRKCVLSYFYEPNDIELSPQLIAIFASGTATHERWQDVFCKTGIALSIEESRQADGIRYTIDAIVDLPPGEFLDMEGPCLVELKGYNRDAFTAMKKAPGPPQDAYQQVQLYMDFYDTVDQYMIIVECKDNQSFYVWRGRRDREAINGVLWRIEIIKQYLAKHMQDDNELPTPLCMSADEKMACQCPMRKACFATRDQRRGMRLPVLDPCEGVTYGERLCQAS